MELLITPAIVVRVVDYGESDRVATLLTERAGKVSALARGARKSRKRYAALEIFGRGEARLKEGRGELFQLDGFDVARGYPHLALDMVKVAHAAYACELARELSPPQQPEPRVFALLDELLSLVDADAPLPGSPHLRVYELGLLSVLGLAPALDRCVTCDRALEDTATIDDEGGHQLDLRLGGVVCGRCGGSAPGRRPLPSRVRRLLLRAQRASLVDVRALVAAEDAAGPDARRAFDGARDALQAILLGHIGHTLRSVEFIAKLNAAHA